MSNVVSIGFAVLERSLRTNDHVPEVQLRGYGGFGVPLQVGWSRDSDGKNGPGSQGEVGGFNYFDGQDCPL